MRALIIAAAITVLATGTAVAANGLGVFEMSPDSTEGALLLAAGARPIDEVGPEVVRFTGAQPMTVRPAVVVEIRRGQGDRARGSVVVLKRTESGVWQRRAVRRFDVPPAAFDRLATRTDTGLATWKGDEPFTPPPRLSEDAPYEVGEICLDGPTYLTERRTEGQSRWQTDYCGDGHPNVDVARQIWTLLPHDVRALVPYLKGDDDT